jgi:hypothetical protein
MVWAANSLLGGVPVFATGVFDATSRRGVSLINVPHCLDSFGPGIESRDSDPQSQLIARTPSKNRQPCGFCVRMKISLKTVALRRGHSLRVLLVDVQDIDRIGRLNDTDSVK